MTNIRRRIPSRRMPRSSLDNVRSMLGPKLRLEHRLCDAAFYVAHHSRTVRHWELLAVAAKRVAAELEADVRAECGKLSRGWKWTARQRRILANQILSSEHDQTLFEYRIKERAFEYIHQVMLRCHERHFDALSNISTNDTRNMSFNWDVYCASLAREPSKSDGNRVDRATNTCRIVGYAVFGDPN